MGRKLLVEGETSADRCKRKRYERYHNDPEYAEAVRSDMRRRYYEYRKDIAWRLRHSERERQRYRERKLKANGNDIQTRGSDGGGEADKG